MSKQSRRNDKKRKRDDDAISSGVDELAAKLRKLEDIKERIPQGSYETMRAKLEEECMRAL